MTPTASAPGASAPTTLASATLADVAQRAGVSTATVSRVLNAPGRVRQATRERVEAVVAELGYTPHFGARALASNRTNTVGAIIPTMENAIFARGIQAMEEALSEHGVTLLVATSHYDMAEEARKLRALLGRGVDAVALIGHARPAGALSGLTRPHVLLWAVAPEGAEAAGAPFAGFDNRAAACAMADLVLDHGHRRIAMLSGLTADNDRAAARVAGVRAALAARGLALSALVEAPYDLDAAAGACAGLLRASPRPSAIVCGNDVLAAGALIGAKSLGLRVPGDVSVTGFDDIDLAMAVDPPLTTIRVPHRRMGRAAAEMLVAMVEGRPVESRTIGFEVVRRRSLGRAATQTSS